jgi:ubiquinone/menaquinone biosynthesis C-methylase UbiE
MTNEQDIFAANAADYEAWYQTPAGQRADALEKGLLQGLMRASYSRPASVLEVGCGTGHFTRWFGEQGLTAVGLDLSAAMLAQARARGAVPLVRGDMQRLPFPDRSFDLVALITTLEFVSQPHQALAEAWRVARQGLLLGVLNRWSLLGWQRRLARRSQATVYDAAHFYGVGELRRLARAVAGARAQVVWRTTLLPHAWPRPDAALPWGGFIGLALVRTTD